MLQQQLLLMYGIMALALQILEKAVKQLQKQESYFGLIPILPLAV
jgi:hypothetical protein